MRRDHDTKEIEVMKYAMDTKDSKSIIIFVCYIFIYSSIFS